MENASKALLIAGAILIVIILIGIILLVKNNVSDFYASEEQIKETEDKTKFNEQFTRFNRNDVQGYELISLVNKVVDYNERVSEVGNNDVKAKKITVNIKLCDSLPNPPKINSTDTTNTKVFQLTYDNELRLFKNASIEQSDNKNTLKDILNDIKTIETNNTHISVLTKKVGNIILSDLNNYSEDDQGKKMIDAIKNYQIATGNNTAYKPSSNNYPDVKKQYDKMISENKNNIFKYYEYVQFKKAVFKCTKLHYDEQTGKVDELNFEFTGKIE